MINLDKYKAEPYEIEQSDLESLPMKDIVELTNYIHNTFVDIMDIMKIHKSNIDKVQAIMKSTSPVK